MAVRTSPAGGAGLPGWVRTREGPEPATIHLTILDATLLTAPAVAEWCRRLAAAGHRRVVTNALPPVAATVLCAASFGVREHLDLFTRALGPDPLPRPRVRSHAVRRRTPLLRLEARAFGPRAFDRFAIRDAVDATPRARVRRIGGARRPAAYAITGLAGARSYVQRLAVDPDCRGRGLARALLADGLRWARRRGAHTAMVNTHADNDAARRLYTSSGFVEVPDGLQVLERAL